MGGSRDAESGSWLSLHTMIDGMLARRLGWVCRDSARAHEHMADMPCQDRGCDHMTLGLHLMYI